jgi:ArsR family transcriptional regulator
VHSYIRKTYIEQYNIIVYNEVKQILGIAMEIDTSFDVEVMRKAAQEATAVLRALANEDRLLLLCQLSQGEKSVSELEELLDIRQPTLSQQLGVLRTEGLVIARRDGKRIYYSVVARNVLELLKSLYALYCPKD